MRHRVADKKFNRDANHRKAMFTGLLRNLTEHGEIVTTLAKAKAMKRLADQMVTRAKKDTVASRRTLHKRFGKRDVVSSLVDRVAPAMADRTSGYVKITPMGPRRGDNTPMASIAFVKKSEQQGLKNPSRSTAKKAVVATTKAVKAIPAVQAEDAVIVKPTETKKVEKKATKPAAKKASKKAEKVAE